MALKPYRFHLWPAKHVITRNSEFRDDYDLHPGLFEIGVANGRVLGFDTRGGHPWRVCIFWCSHGGDADKTTAIADDFPSFVRAIGRRKARERETPLEQGKFDALQLADFWRDYFGVPGFAGGLRSYGEIEEWGLQLPLPTGHRLVLFIEPSAPWHSLALRCPTGDSFELGRIEPIPSPRWCLRWEEVERFGRHAAKQNPRLPHPGLPLLLLTPFAYVTPSGKPASGRGSKPRSASLASYQAARLRSWWTVCLPSGSSWRAVGGGTLEKWVGCFRKDGYRPTPAGCSGRPIVTSASGGLLFRSASSRR